MSSSAGAADQAFANTVFGQGDSAGASDSAPAGPTIQTGRFAITAQPEVSWTLGQPGSGWGISDPVGRFG